MAAARKVAALKRVTVLFVERDGRLVGVLDERALAASADDAEVAATMQTIGLCLHPSTSVWRARELFIWSRVSVLPVTVGAFLLGAITRADVDEALRPPSVGATPRRAGTARARPPPDRGRQPGPPHRRLGCRSLVAPSTPVRVSVMAWTPLGG